MENLAWLGMEWDESPAHPGEYGPYRQSERKEIYQPLIDQLLAAIVRISVIVRQKN